MLNIADEDIFELVDVSHEDLENTFETLADKIIAQVSPLGNFTGIGNNLKFQAGGVHWKNLKPVVFQMIEDGHIREEKRKVGKENVDSIVLSDLDQIEFKLSDKDQRTLQILISAQQRVDADQLQGDEEKTFRNKKILGMNWKRFQEAAMQPEKGRDSIVVGDY